MKCHEEFIWTTTLIACHHGKDHRTNTMSLLSRSRPSMLSCLTTSHSERLFPSRPYLGVEDNASSHQKLSRLVEMACSQIGNFACPRISELPNHGVARMPDGTGHRVAQTRPRKDSLAAPTQSNSAQSPGALFAGAGTGTQSLVVHCFAFVVVAWLRSHLLSLS